MEFVFAAIAIALVAAFVLVPVRRRDAVAADTSEAEIEDLEARKLAKYREIRDTELDHAQGKIDDADFATQDAELRAEAVAILKRLDEVKSEGGR